MVQATHCPENAERAAERQTSSLAGLAVVLALIVAGLYLVEAMRACAASNHLGG